MAVVGVEGGDHAVVLVDGGVQSQVLGVQYSYLKKQRGRKLHNVVACVAKAVHSRKTNRDSAQRSTHDTHRAIAQRSGDAAPSQYVLERHDERGIDHL